MKILVADDHPVVLKGICSFLASKKHKIICTCTNGIEAWNSINVLQPDIALIDHNMPGMTGVEIAERIQSEGLEVKVVLLTMHKEKSLLDKAISCGVYGYLLKDFALDEVEQCLQNVHNGQNYYSKELARHLVIGEMGNTGHELDVLTVTEQKILRIIATQRSSQEIADMLFISVKTVEKHRSNIIRKLGLPHSPNSLIIWAAKNLK